MEKIAIFVGATGAYSQYLKQFVETARKFLFPTLEKRFIIFTDQPDIVSGDDIRTIHVEARVWPHYVMRKFKYIIDSVELWANVDWCALFNVNIRFQHPMPTSILPGENDELAILSFGWHSRKRPPVETRPQFRCALRTGHKERDYWQASMVLGARDKFLIACTKMEQDMCVDREKGLVAVWHDESYLNHYCDRKKIKLITYDYCYPEGCRLKADLCTEEEAYSVIFRKEEAIQSVKLER